jgi:tryptophanyl-tRNA synthetase
MPDDFNVTPYDVEGSVNYEKLMQQFGIRPLNEEMEARIKKLAGETHYLIRRKIYFAQRELSWLLDEYEKGNRFYVYTGIAPSGSMTVGHLLPFIMAQWLQEKFDADVYIQVPDEEKFLNKNDPKLTLEYINGLAHQDALDIAALGFKPKKTKIYFDTEHANQIYKHAVRVAKRITFSTIKDAFGFSNETNIGAIFYTSTQAVGTFIKSAEENRKIPCLIPLGVDQDVHFRIARDVVEKLGYYKPAIIHSKFLPGLKGEPKMSSSDPNGAIYLSDSPEEVDRKVNRAITGQQSTAELQKKYGGDPDKCSVCQYYKYLFETDDRKLERIFTAERDGSMLAGEHKADLARKINAFLEKHRKERDRIKDRMDDFILH